MLGEDGEATVDGIHFTDLGVMRLLLYNLCLIEYTEKKCVYTQRFSIFPWRLGINCLCLLNKNA